jgi:hypothetical protein
LEIEVKNFRCFSDAAPVRWALRPGFTSLVGVNNSGKSSLHRFFHDFRQIFSILSSPNGNLFASSLGGQETVNVLSVRDPEEVYSNTNDRDMHLRFALDEAYRRSESGPVPSAVLVTVRRGLAFTIALEANGRSVELASWDTKWRCPTGECSPASRWVKAGRLNPLVPRESKRWSRSPDQDAFRRTALSTRRRSRPVGRRAAALPLDTPHRRLRVKIKVIARQLDTGRKFDMELGRGVDLCGSPL